jgi:hypothetical protein
MKKLFVALLIVMVLAGGAFAATESGVEPVEVDGNPLSGQGADNHKVEPVEGDEGSIEIPTGVELDDLGSDYPDVSEAPTIEVHYSVSEDGKYLDWWSQEKVAEVVVKGGNAANIYYYYDGDGNYLGLWDDVNGVWYDRNLQAPEFTNPKGKVIVPEISNFGFFARTPEQNGNGNGNGTPPTLTNGVFRTSTPIHVTPMALPSTGGNFFYLLTVGLGMLFSGIAITKRF